MGSMELNPEILKTSATIDCMEQNASVAAAALLALTIVKMTRNPAELMYSTPPRSTTTSATGRGMKIFGTFSVGQRPGVTCAKKAKSKG